MSKTKMILIFCLLSSAKSQSLSFSSNVLDKATEMTALSGQDKEYYYSGLVKRAAVGASMFTLGYTPRSLESELVFCTELINLGVKDNANVLLMKLYTEKVNSSYIKLFVEKNKVTNKGTAATICHLGDVYKESLNQVIYVPKNSSMMLPYPLTGHTITFSTNTLLEISSKFK